MLNKNTHASTPTGPSWRGKSMVECEKFEGIKKPSQDQYYFATNS